MVHFQACLFFKKQRRFTLTPLRISHTFENSNTYHEPSLSLILSQNAEFSFEFLNFNPFFSKNNVFE